jgi:HEPN domain-containing protein
MLLIAELDQLAQARLQDSKVLLVAGRYDGATYLCGYAVEIALKARICRTLDWRGFPASRKEFEGYASFRTHSLDVLLRLSGQENRVKQQHFLDWNVVAVWDPESRYHIIGSVPDSDAGSMITAADALLKVL